MLFKKSKNEWEGYLQNRIIFLKGKRREWREKDCILKREDYFRS